MKQLPMCWKCINAVMKDEGAFKRFEYCKEKPEIKNFEDAVEKCPLATLKVSLFPKFY